MTKLHFDQLIPIYSLLPQQAAGGSLFEFTRIAGTPTFRVDMLVPHRKDYYTLVFVERGGSRHWVDMVPYEVQANTLYFTTPGELQVKECIRPMWGVSLAFTREFLALPQHPALTQLALLQNPQQGHALRLTAAEVSFVDYQLTLLEAEYQRPGEWQHRMLTAHLTVLVTYLSRLYTEQFPGHELSAEKALLSAYQLKIEENFRELHEVGAYAALLNCSAGHLSEVIRRQSGRPARVHIQARLVLEARRLLFHTPWSVKEIAFHLGFADASYFARFFKREAGLTPAAFRASNRDMYR